ncbi:hypothetical protein ACN2C6_18285 [Caulobacter sp. ErkDOM-YI]|uniref:hypothetical protein n=1 Tax=unclassified Caulobacter TaxID=2648921 RepID=UPI003AF9DF1D
MAANVTLSSKRPAPPKADFAFEIDFKRGEGSASRVFAATHDFIKACERIDKELLTSISSGIETVMVLEDIQVGSIKTWLRNALVATDDQALKDLDWKPLVGKYLVRAKYAIIRWVDDDTVPKSLPDLARELQGIAAETDVRHLPDYRAPGPKALIEAVRDFQGVKDHLLPTDRAIYITGEGDRVEMNLSMRWDIEDIEAMAVKQTLEFPVATMILAVKKPDYLGDSKWELRHGKRTVSARIEDVEWLKRFQARQEDVRPGDALKCDVRIEHLYGHDNELLTERYTILKVYEVLVDSYSQLNLPDIN